MEGRTRLKGGEIRVGGRRRGAGGRRGEKNWGREGKKRKVVRARSLLRGGRQGAEGGEGWGGSLLRVHPFRMGESYPFIPNSVQLFQGRRVENASANRKARQPISFPIGPKIQIWWACLLSSNICSSVAEYESKLRSGLTNRRPGWPSLFSECVK